MAFRLWDVLRHEEIFGLCIFGIMAILSIASWSLFLFRLFFLKKLYKYSEHFIEKFWEARSLMEFNEKASVAPYSPARELFRSGFHEMVRVLQLREKRQISEAPMLFDTVKRSLSKQTLVEESVLYKRIPFLSLCVACSPFIGLLGTVMGVVQAFYGIGSKGASSSLAAVAPGISEALVATALGLCVAIPAAIFFHILSDYVRNFRIMLESFSCDILNILERHYTIRKGD